MDKGDWSISMCIFIESSKPNGSIVRSAKLMMGRGKLKFKRRR